MQRLLTTLVLFVSVCVAFPAAAVEYRSVNAPTVLYDAPSQRGVKLFVIFRDTPVEVVVSIEGWSKVRDAEGSLAWIEKKYLSDRRMVIVRSEHAEIRQTADEGAPLVLDAGKNVALEYVGTVAGGWIEVRRPDGAPGFVRANEVWGF